MERFFLFLFGCVCSVLYPRYLNPVFGMAMDLSLQMPGTSI